MDAVSEIKGRLSIEDVLSEYVQLKRAGRNFKGLSPFSNEKTPSFIVSPEKQIWHDFSSGKGGDVFSFVMEVEGLDFKGALELLARKAGVELEQYQNKTSAASSKLKARALETLELAAKFYQKHLSVSQPALDYLINKRRFSKKTILEWQLGYAPTSGTALADFLGKKGFTTDEMKRAGLVSVRNNGARDMFRGRIMIPLCDANGLVVGFTARLLADEPNAPKYINTPQTITYDKSRQIYGLHLAKEAIRKSAIAVVVEGNLDVISSHQAAVRNVVASAGTAMTEQHLKILKRFTGDVRLSFDADPAGIAATERMIPIAQKAEVSLKIISIHGAKDPDELVAKNPKDWVEAIDKAQYAPDWLIDRYKSQVDLASAAGKRAFTDTLLDTIRRLSDPVEQEHYLKEIAKITDTSLEAVKAKFDQQVSPRQLLKKAKNINLDSSLEIEQHRLQDHLLAITLAQPKIREVLKNCRAEYFTDGPPRKLLEFLKQNPDFKGNPKTASKLQQFGDYVKIVMLQFEELFAEFSLEDLTAQATQLKHRLIDRYVKIQKQKLADAMKTADSETELKKLVQKADKLNTLLIEGEGV